MEASQQLTGAHTTASPSGQFIASIATGKLKICATHAPERFTEINIRIQAKDVTALRWSEDSDRIAIVSHHLVEVIDLQDDSHRIRLDNGSGGLGKFSSADFIGLDQLLVIWEFGKEKVWNLSTGKSVDLADIKTTCTGSNRQLRPIRNNKTTQESTAATTPGNSQAGGTTQTLATLSRTGADDTLQIYLPALQKTISSAKLSTIDAQSLSWSPDGRWLAVLDTPTASTSVNFYTPDGHLFRSYSSPQDSSHSGLGIKSISWSGNSQIVGLARFDGKIVLLNTRTFTPLAMVEHHTVIDQSFSAPEQQAPIWQEVVSASGERSYTAVSQPFCPPLSKVKAGSEPSELGVAEACFSCDGAYLATRDEHMLNTVWIWDSASLGAHAVVVQHSNVRKMHWHPSRPDALLLDCGEAIAYLFSAIQPQQPPTTLSSSLSGSPTLSWFSTQTNALPAILTTTKSSFQLLYPEGRPSPTSPNNFQTADNAENTMLSENQDDDSLLDLLAGRTPLPPQSYTERIDIEVETEERDSTTRMDDTFRGKQIFSRGAGLGGRGRSEGEMDPFDDSQIF